MRNFGYDEDGRTISLSDFSHWRRIFGYTKRHWLPFTAAVLLSLLVTGSTLAQPWLMQIGIDNYITNTALDGAERVSGLSVTAFWYGLMVLSVFVISFLQVLLLEYIGQSIMHWIRQDLFSNLLRLDLAFFNTTPTGRLVTRLTNDIQNMHEMFTSVMVTLFNDVLRLAGILIALFLMNTKLALLMSGFVPVSLVATVVFARLARERFREIRTQLARINSFLSETISGLSVLQFFNREATTRERFEKLNEGYLHRTLAQIKLFGTFMPITEFMSSAAIALILWYGGREILGERLTVGELVAFISYMRLFFQPLRELSQKFSIVQSAMASAERIFQLLDTRAGIVDPKSARGQHEFKGELQLEGVTFAYEEGNPVIRNLNLELEPGSTVALVGTTGSGKSTLVNLLLRFYEPQQGTISIDGLPIDAIPLQRLRNLVGVVLQDTLILQDSLLANIAMDTGRTRDEIQVIMDKTGMNRFIDKLPEGLDTRIGDGGQELSTGEKQLLSFARILCRDPKIVILDEATAAVDTESENILEDAIAEIFAGRTSLIIAHRLSTIRRADRIVAMEHGQVIEEGTHDELLAAGGYYSELVAMDIQSGHAGRETQQSEM